MSQKVIDIVNLGKQYRLGQVGTTTMADDLKRWWYNVRGKEDPFLTVGEENDRTKKATSEYVWALKDINFSVNQGEVLGIIGKNGAGKSTLLKILSRTTAPTTGEYKIKGRVASLLEVGTGFHPDLTGKENVFLNGAILGMTKAEIKNKFDEIVDFSGVERYIDTPVKRYSSGMYVRLAFAVAAHLESEILVVDEVLAVGDQDFQNKCMGKMKDVSVQGRTVLFVSHNMASMKSLCNRGILMRNGTLMYDGSMSDAITNYLAGLNSGSNSGIIESFHRVINTGSVFYRKVQIINEEFVNGNSIYFNNDVTIIANVEFLKAFENVIFDTRVLSLDGIEILNTMNIYDAEPFHAKQGKVEIKICIQNKLQPGRYFINLGVHLSDGSTLDYLEHIFEINVLNIGKDKQKGLVYDFKLGYYRPNTEWIITQ
jgi:lipopolysaccharide transport system ATP-binding protein